MGCREVGGFVIPILEMGEAAGKVRGKSCRECGVQPDPDCRPAAHPSQLVFHMVVESQGKAALHRLGDSRSVCVTLCYFQIAPNSYCKSLRKLGMMFYCPEADILWNH